jgi:hypothetical protein
MVRRRAKRFRMTVYQIVGMVWNSTGIVLGKKGTTRKFLVAYRRWGFVWRVLYFILHDPAYNIFVVDLKAEIYAAMLRLESAGMQVPGTLRYRMCRVAPGPPAIQQQKYLPPSDETTW